MESAKISIVTPSFNQGGFIEEAIQSVFNQGYDNFEHIIVDNCSTDNTLEILKRYPHLKYVSEPDKGQSDAINKGFKMATGDIIGWLNSDDYYLPGTFKKVNDCLADPHVDGIYSNVQFVDAHGTHTRNLISHRPLKWLSLLYTFIQSTSFFFRRNIIDADILLDTELNLCMDQDFYVRLLYSGYKLQYIDDYFAAFRWHGNNKSMLTDDVMRNNAIEGLKIINKYTSLHLKPDRLNILLYKSAHKYVAKPVRGCLKLLPAKRFS